MNNGRKQESAITAITGAFIGPRGPGRGAIESGSGRRTVAETGSKGRVHRPAARRPFLEPLLDIILGIWLALVSAAIAVNADYFPYVTNPTGIAVYFWLAFALALGVVLTGIASFARPRFLAKANLVMGRATIATGALFLIVGGRFAQTGAGDFLATGMFICLVSLPFIIFGAVISMVSKNLNKCSPEVKGHR